MQFVIKGKNMDVSDKLRRFVETKIARLERVLPSTAEAEVEISGAKTKSADTRYIVQVTLKTNGTLIRGEQYAADTYSAMDAVLDKLDRQIARYRTKRGGKAASTPRTSQVEEDVLPPGEDDEEEEGHLVRRKRFAMKPMDVEEALMQMQMLGHDFFVFQNSETERVGVVYRRRDGDFGLIEPEFV